MKKTQILRYISLFFFLILITILAYYKQKIVSTSPYIDVLCPFTGLENIYLDIKNGTWFNKILPSSLILFVSVILLTIALGRVFCGWLCPMGALSEIFNFIGTKLKISKRKLPSFFDKIFRLIRYILLILGIVLTCQAGAYVFSDYDPWLAYMRLISLSGIFTYGLLILISILILELFFSRFWCKYLCPLGAFFALFAFFSPVKVRRNLDTCINCQKCDKICPVDIKISQKTTVGYSECISCALCTELCPEDNTLNFALKNRKITISALAIGLIAIIAFGIFYSLSSVTALQQESPASLVQNPSPVDNILADMNMRQVAESVGLPVKKVINIVGLDPNIDLDIAIKSNPKVNVTVLREKLFAYFEKNPLENHESPIVVGEKILSPDDINETNTMEEIISSFNLEKDAFMEKVGTTEQDLKKSTKEVGKKINKGLNDIKESVKELIK